MKWKLIAVTGGLTGAALWLVQRNRARKASADAARWAEATDRVTRFGA